MSEYLFVRSSNGLGAFNIEQQIADMTGRIVSSVASRLTTEISRAVDQGVERVATSATAGFDRFFQGPQGQELQAKISGKAAEVVAASVQRHQVNFILLGIAGAALVMGSVGAGSKLSPGATKLSFVVAGVAAALAASGVLSQEPPLPPAPLKKVAPLPRVAAR